MMEIKSFFMNEINDLRQEISSLHLKLQQEKLNQLRNNNVCGKDKKIIIKRREGGKTTDGRIDSLSK